MRVRLIQPSQCDVSGKPIKYRKLFLPFLTLSTLAGLSPSGVEVGITEDCIEDIDFDEPVDLVGLTAITCQAPRAYQIADEFRRRGRKVIMGGIHASMCPEEALRHCDSICIGEAENLWTDILDDAHAGRLKRIYRSVETVELSRLVIPRFDLLDYSHYVRPPLGGTPLIPLQTSRGCPHQCEFCSVTQYLGRRVRTKPVSHVLSEIDAIQPSRVFFTDDNIVGNRSHARELFAALKPLHMRWACQMSTCIGRDPDLIEAAADAGCHETYIGIESLQPTTLKAIDKGFNRAEEYADLFKRLRQVGIIAQASLVFGFDGDSLDDLRRTIDHVLKWDINYMYITILTPLPGTPLYIRVERDGRLIQHDWSQYDTVTPVMTFNEKSSDELLSVFWAAYRRFYAYGQILRRLWRYRREYIRFFPRDNALEELVFQWQMHRSVNRGDHPFSLGMRV